jgi:hypothetical protein
MFKLNGLTLNLLTTTIVAPPSNACKWQMGFNSAFKGLIGCFKCCELCCHMVTGVKGHGLTSCRCYCVLGWLTEFVLLRSGRLVLDNNVWMGLVLYECCLLMCSEDTCVCCTQSDQHNNRYGNKSVKLRTQF